MAQFFPYQEYNIYKKICPGFRDGLSYSTPQKKKAKMPLLSLGSIPFKNVEYRDGMGPRLGNGISLVSLLFEGWSMTVEEHHNQLSMVKSNIETSSLSDCLVLSGDNSCVMM